MRYNEKDRSFFMQPADVLAPQLLGKCLCRKLSDGTVVRFRITETEAYCHDDSACYGTAHADCGNNEKITKATAPLFEKGATCCIYAQMLLIACGPEGKPDNVLIRKAGNQQQYCDGPNLLCQALQIDKSLHGKDLLSKDATLWMEDDGAVRAYCAIERVGLGKNVKDADREKKHRFIVL